MALGDGDPRGEGGGGERPEQPVQSQAKACGCSVSRRWPGSSESVTSSAATTA